jgi:hypothetical protein
MVIFSISGFVVVRRVNFSDKDFEVFEGVFSSSVAPPFKDFVRSAFYEKLAREERRL